ncbi:SURF1 family protein [Arthrobacter roseus]|uniref:SURF1 family cytochrome oxidase biogenesis protein n=1 Tax=Arthrobacter roseus TaxID=136274 RepID=UPI003084687C|nr:cytochrome oxidase assembly protein ShyY1 [Arthrobacter roseus]
MRYGFLFSGRWIGWLVLTVAFAAACSALGSWQMDRRDLAVATVDRVAANYSQTPVPFADVGGVFEDFKPSTEWTPVSMEGTYATEDTRVVRNRPFSGRPGYEVLVPLHLESGATVIINRGWLPIGNNNAGHPDTVPPPPQGEVSVIARIKPAEPDVRAGAPQGQLASINLNAYQQQLNYPIFTGSYGLLGSEDPSSATAPRALPKPDIDTGPHLSYSLQWFAFGLLGFVGLGYAARQQALSNAAAKELGQDQDGMHQAWKHTAPKPSRKSSRPTAEEEEDALLDAQGYQ